MSRKRALSLLSSIADVITNKRQKFDITTAATTMIDSTWVTASETRNYLLGDPFCDWVKYFGSGFSLSPSSPHSRLQSRSPSPSRKTHFPSSTTNSPKSTSSSPSSYLMKQGNLFEENIVSKIKQKFTSKDILCLNVKHYNAKDVESYQQTVNAINLKIPIIFGGVLHNHVNKTYGIPDLIVRRDYMNKLFSAYDGESDENYCIVDVKFTTLSLKSNGRDIFNNGSVPAYKGQLWVYTEALKLVQPRKDIPVECAYILGRGAKFSKGGVVVTSRDPFEYPGVITYSKHGHDEEIPHHTRQAMAWLRKLKNEGGMWNVFEPQCKEMYPNMSNTYTDTPQTRKIKEQVSRHIGEISEVWMCGESARKLAHANGVYSWRDKRCTSSIMGFGDGSKTSKIVDEMLAFNREDNDTFIKYNTSIFDDDMFSQQSRHPYPNEFYIDFEMTIDISSNESVSSSLIFMIGVCFYNCKKNRRETKVFFTDDISSRGENKVCSDFIEFVKMHVTDGGGEEGGKGGDIKLVHWSPTERWRWDKFLKATTPRFQRAIQRGAHSIEFVDMYELFKKHTILVKGCLNFKLKTIAKKLREYGAIKSGWEGDESGTIVIGDGMSAITELYSSLESHDPQKIRKTLRDIEKYNKIDVQVLYEIMEFLRTQKNQRKI